MRWFRDNVRHGSWVALVALAINLALSFGHVHALDGDGPGRHSGAQLAALATDSDRSQGHSGDGHPDDLCPICVAAAAIATGLAPMPPVVAVDFAVVRVDHAIAPFLEVAESRRAAFQSRGPPIS
jgi:hypothetical protein